jgi:hypothetical protein
VTTGPARGVRMGCQLAIEFTQSAARGRRKFLIIKKLCESVARLVYFLKSLTSVDLRNQLCNSYCVTPIKETVQDYRGNPRSSLREGRETTSGSCSGNGESKIR